MNYSKSYEMKKRLKITLLITLISGMLFGYVVGSLITHITANAATKTDRQLSQRGEEKMLVYGKYDDQCYTKEININWESGKVNFIPLKCEMPEKEQEFTYYLCSGYNLDFTLVMALIKTESNFDCTEISNTDDYGYMQINQINHQWLTDTLGVTNFTDPYQNVRAGVFVLRKLFERYQDTNMVLMAYNMGEDAAGRLWERGIYSTDYTQKVLQNQEKFNKQLGV